MFKWWFIFMGFFMVCMIVAGAIDKKYSQKIDTCVDVANEIGLDPNGNERSDFIKECYEK